MVKTKGNEEISGKKLTEETKVKLRQAESGGKLRDHHQTSSESNESSTDKKKPKSRVQEMDGKVDVSILENTTQKGRKETINGKQLRENSKVELKENESHAKLYERHEQSKDERPSNKTYSKLNHDTKQHGRYEEESARKEGGKEQTHSKESRHGFKEDKGSQKTENESSQRKGTEHNFDIKHRKLSQEELSNVLSDKVRTHKELYSKVKESIPVDRELDEVRKEEKYSSSIKETVEQGIRGETSPLYDDIKQTMLKEDKPIHKQLYSHEKGLKYEGKAKQLKSKGEIKAKKADKTHEKIKSKKVKRVGKHAETVVDEKTGQPYSKVKYGYYKEDVKLRQGERTTSQKLQYQALHQPKQTMKRDFEEAEQMEGNEGVQVAHRTETLLKDKVVKPFIRDNFGYDRHQVKEKKLRHKEKVLGAKEDVNKVMSESLLQSNPISRTIQKRNIKKRIYQEKGLYKSPVQRVKDFIGGMFRFADPFYKVKQTWHAISTAFSAMGFIIQSILNSAMFIVVILVPIIAFVSIFSIFFGFGESPNIEIASMSRYWNEQLTDIRMEIIEADEDEAYSKSNYYPVDEVRIAGGVDINVALEKIRQVQVIGYVSALLQDELTKSKGEDVLQAAFDELYKVNQEHVDEGWWEEQIVGYEPIEIDRDAEGNIIGTSGGDAIYEDVWVEYWVLYLSLEQGDINDYVLNEFEQLNEDSKELALLQYQQYQEGLGYGQIGRNPFDETFDWRNNVSSVYGYRIMSNNKELHNGLDVAVPVGTPLYAIADGKVTAVGSGSTEGNYVYYEIESAGTTYLVKYLHLDSVNVRRGDTIVEGQLLALSGNTGRSTGAHLHLQIEEGGKKTNPLFLVGFPQ